MSSLELMFLLFVVSVGGGVLPLFVRDSARVLHLLLCLAAGFFLGVVFLHLLPELTHSEIDSHAIWGWVLGGLLLVLFLDLGIFGKQSHAAVGWATLLGLSVHAFAMGLSLGAVPRIELVLAWALLPHKFGESFSLTSAMRFTLRDRRSVFGILVLFSVATPLGMLLAKWLLSDAQGEYTAIVSAIAAGSFLYVAVGDLLPEVFHEAEDRLSKLGLLLLGVGFAAWSSAGHEHDHSHAHEHPHPHPHPHEPAEPGPVLMWLESFWSFFESAAPFLLLGFVVAALIRAFLPRRWLGRLLGRDDLGSVVTASVIGAPLPLCSCSVLPTALSLHKRGASKSATVAFLVSTPETGVDSIGVTWALLDPAMTIARPLGAVCSATAAGIATGLAGSTGAESERAHSEPGDSEGHDHHHDEGGHLVTKTEEPAGRRLRKAMRYSFFDMFDDIMPSLLVGTAIASLVGMLLPADFLGASWASGIVGMLIAAMIGVPIYVCASASTPIAAAFMLKGLSPGAALVFLLVGPATNLGSVFVLDKLLGRRTVVVYLVSVVVSAIVLGLLLNAFYSASGLTPQVRAREDATHGFGVISTVCAVLLAVWSAMSIWRRGWLQRLFGSEAPAHH